MKNPVAMLASRVGIQHAGRATLAIAVVLILVGVGAFSLMALPGDSQWSPGITEGIKSVSVPGDGDGDGLQDALENRVGSDLARFSTLGGGVPDGWIYHWYAGVVDWNDTGFLQVRALVPDPMDLPPDLRDPTALSTPTLEDLYHAEDAHHRSKGLHGAWWLLGDALDPRVWDNDGDGVADAWMLNHGLHPVDVEADSPSSGDASLTVREKYERGLDPTARDSDGDGLWDVEEIAGLARLAGSEVRFEPTDPLRLSSRADGVSDGYLVRFGLDPSRADAADTVPAGDGVTVRESFRATRAACPAACDWRNVLDEGPLVDPTSWDSNGDGVADAWAIRDPHGVAHPLADARTQVVDDTQAWDASPWDGDLSRLHGVVVDGTNPPPDSPFELTVADSYAFQRPAAWDEATQGPWWGGLPTVVAPMQESLPPAVALRGWDVVVDVSLGRTSDEAPEPGNRELVRVRATADPRLNDTDGDGLADREEYYGVSGSQTVSRTSPDNADTDGDGLLDGEELGPASFGTDPLRRDSSGSFLTDGQEVEHWSRTHKEALEALVEGGGMAYSWLPDAGGVPDVARLRPDGDLDGDGVPNVLSHDSDGDGIRDGAELFPNRFLDPPSKFVRPATDPARRDTDADGLPDAWEVAWSRDTYFECAGGCIAPPGARVDGWPLDPSRTLSVDLADAGTDATDAAVNLAGDSVITSVRTAREFSNLLAYQYGLDPYDADTNDDGIPDMFSIHWGVENIPAPAAAAAREMAWPVAEHSRVVDSLRSAGAPGRAPHGVVVINPRIDSEAMITPGDSLLGVFTEREKGTWIVTDPCTPGEPDGSMTLPTGDDPRTESAHGDTVPDRTALPPLKAGICWTWITYPLQEDIIQGTNPWEHDSDADGLPDAWEDLAYDLPGVQGAGTLSSSIQTGCRQQTLTTGLGAPADGDHCISYLEAYTRGLDPRADTHGDGESRHDGDTDRGGLADWLEIALDLDPLDPLDDEGTEDWDADGLINAVEDDIGTNRLIPDTDGDGLLDGDLEGTRYESQENIPDEDLPFLQPGKGNGDLCLPGPGHPLMSSNVPNMEERPESFGGPLTYQQLHASFVQHGILHDPGSTECGDDLVLFKREGIYSQSRDLVLGSGGGSASLQWDTSGDGVPDGWMVYWRDRRDDSRFTTALDPATNTSALPSSDPAWDPDSDFLPTREEYGWPAAGLPPGVQQTWGRPDGWREARDGPWWGGLDPTLRDTDGDGVWHERVGDADDRADQDLDSDGIPDRYDVSPGIDFHNDGIVAWDDGAGRYVTDFTALWDALATRDSRHLDDSDSDNVPTFLDRARARVDLHALPSSNINKGVRDAFAVTGNVIIDESPDPDGGDYGPPVGDAAGDGATVGGATVKAILSDGATEAVVGFGFTDQDGGFTIHVSTTGLVDGGKAPPDGASVEGRLVEGGTNGTIQSEAPDLMPTRDATLRIEVEANDPKLQPLTFADKAQVEAYKDRPFPIPDGLADGGTGAPAQWVAVRQTGDPGPDPDVEQIRHGADAVFPVSSATHAITLRSPTVLRMDDPPAATLEGEALHVAGTFRDASGRPLAGRNISVLPQRDGAAAVPATTDEDGSFEVIIGTRGLDLGLLEVKAEALLDPDDPDDAFLEPPDAALVSTIIHQNMTWTDVAVAGHDASIGTIPVDAAEPLHVTGRLLNHHGEPVADRDVQVLLVTLDAPTTPVRQRNTATDETGHLEAMLDVLPPGLESGDMQLFVQADTITAADRADPAVATVRPQYATTIVGLTNASALVGEPATVESHLLRSDGAPVDNPAAEFLAVSDQESIWFNGTDADGRFRFAVNGTLPARQTWSVLFLGNEGDGGGNLRASAPSNVTIVHQSPTSISFDVGNAVRGSPVRVQGSLNRTDGEGVPDADVMVSWPDGNGTLLTTDEQGRFRGDLGAWRSQGQQTVTVEFSGSELLLPSVDDAQVPVRMPTHLILHAPETVILSNDTSETVLSSGMLTDMDGRPLADRRVAINFTRSDRVDNSTVEATTDLHGRFAVTNRDLALPVPLKWAVGAHYAGQPLETPVSNETTLFVYHRVDVRVLRVPGSVDAGGRAILSGVLEAPSDQLSEVTLTAAIQGVVVGRTAATPGDAWSMPVDVPLIANGSYGIDLRGHGPPGLHIQPDRVQVVVTSTMDIRFDEVVQSDGGREVTVTLSTSDGQVVEGVHLVVVRLDGDGDFLGDHEVTMDTQGRAVFRLDASQGGNLSAVVVDSSLRIGKVERETQPFVVTSEAGPRNWLWWTMASALSLCAVAVGTYIAWRRRYLRTLGDAFAYAQESLLDANASPAEVVRAVYERILWSLQHAGYGVSGQETVRDIAASATREFSLPRGPMGRVSQLFEVAVYSDSDKNLGSVDRKNALAAFREISSHLRRGVVPPDRGGAAT